RHTRSYGDWSSDVCSSDLVGAGGQVPRANALVISVRAALVVLTQEDGRSINCHALLPQIGTVRSASRHVGNHDRTWRSSMECFRSEERRVGKEWRERVVGC